MKRTYILPSSLSSVIEDVNYYSPYSGKSGMIHARIGKRHCPVCKTLLSRYNLGRYCFVHSIQKGEDDFQKQLKNNQANNKRQQKKRKEAKNG